MNLCHYYPPSAPEVNARLVAERLIGASDGVYVVRSKGRIVSIQSSVALVLEFIGAREAGMHHSIEYVSNESRKLLDKSAECC